MAYNHSSLDWGIAGAFGDNAELMAELRGALVTDAREALDKLTRSRCDANWTGAATRLRSLAASFGATGLLEAALEALNAAPGDPVALRKVDAAIARLVPN